MLTLCLDGCENKKCEFYAVCESDGVSEASCVCPKHCEEGTVSSLCHLFFFYKWAFSHYPAFETQNSCIGIEKTTMPQYLSGADCVLSSQRILFTDQTTPSCRKILLLCVSWRTIPWLEFPPLKFCFVLSAFQREGALSYLVTDWNHYMYRYLMYWFCLCRIVINAH